MALPPGHGDGTAAPEPHGRDGQGPSDEEVDRRFAELMAGFAPGEPEAPSPAPAPPSEPGTVGGPRDYTVAEEPDEGFVPPEPEPIGSADPLLVIAWVAAIGAPIAFILLLVLWSTAPGIVWVTALLAMLAGWGVVIWRLPRSRNPSDGDDGAVL